jgi:hypothetical protein
MNISRLEKWPMNRLIAVALLGSRVFAATSIVRVNATPQQLLVVTTTDQPGFCTYRVSEGSTFAAPVNDVNAGLFAGSNSDARNGSIIDGRSHTFVVGLRTAAMASDHKRYSRSLQSNTPHWIGVTCGSDAEVSVVKSTTNPPLGNSWAEPYPYDANSPTGYAWPSIDLADKSKSYIDPRTGTLIKRITGWQDEANSGDAPVTPTTPSVSSSAPSGNWTNPQNGAVADGNSAVSTGTAPLAVAFSPIRTSFNATRPPSWDPNLAGSTITSVQVMITGSGTGGANNAGVCLTVNRVSCATDTHTITLPSTTGSVTYPESMTNYFADWVGGTITTPPVNYDMATFAGTVNVAGTTVTCAAPSQQVCFNVETLKAGSVINIGTATGCTAGDYVIAALNSDSSLTLQTTAGGCSGVSYSAANFGVLIFPQASSVLSVDGVTYTWDEHGFGLNPQGGLSFYCNYGSQVTNSSGVKGWVCMLPDAFGNMPGYFVPSNLGDTGMAANTIWSHIVPGNPDASIDYASFPQDQTAQSRVSSYLSSIPSDPADPTTFYALAVDTQVSPNKTVLLSAQYDAAGTNPTCSSGGEHGYQQFTQANANSQNPCLIWKNRTRASQGGTLTDLFTAFDASFDPNYFNQLAIVDVKNGIIEISAATAQNLLTWFFFVSTSNFQVTAGWPLYKNFPIRWSGVHGAITMTDNTTTAATTQNLDPGGACAIDGCGPYQFVVSAINGSGSTTLAAAAGGTCSHATSQTAALLANGSGCVQMTFPGEPCDPDPSPYELTNSPACSWNPGYRGLWVGSATSGAGMPLAAGDTFIDLATGEGVLGGEQFMVTGRVSGNTWEVLRNFALPHGSFQNDPRLSTLKAHGANFTARFMSGLSAKDCEYYGDFTTDAHGVNLTCDQTYYPTSHGDIYGRATVISEYFTNLNVVAFSVRTGSSTNFLSQVNQTQNLFPAAGTTNTISANTGVAFGNGCQFISGLGCGSQNGGYLGAGHTLLADSDDHPSVRKGAAPASEEQAFLSSTRIGSFVRPIGGTTVTAVSGSLYKIASVNMPFASLTPFNTRYRPFLFWAGRHNMTDISGPGSSIDGTAGNNWKYCVALLANECASGSVPGAVYANVPAAPTNLATGCTSGGYQNGWCVMPVSPDMDAITQIRYDVPSTNDGERARTLVKPFAPWFGTNSFFNGHFMPDASGVIFNCDWCSGVRPDLYWAKLPPTPPTDSINRSNYVNVPVTLSGVAGDQVRIRFGYAENGPPASLFCMTRQEACATDASGANPFVYLSETQHFTACGSGCTVNIPAVPGRVVYYVVDRLNGTIRSGPLQTQAVN